SSRHFPEKQTVNEEKVLRATARPPTISNYSNYSKEYSPHNTRREMDAERDALVILYRTTNGDSWRNKQGWCTDAPLSEWHGVKVSDGRIVELDLGANNLQGPIPSELESMTALQELSLSKNQLTGPIPSELGNMTALQRLSLQSNNLTGPIPRELGYLAALLELTLYFNRLT
ncbi:unnamed protein product, partial [Ascophyllum nodosum]